ncbi:TPA: hypothetical protein EYP83_00635 [Candidatus Geothermarchaeota archaeon]|nr:hypothetical protein [Candidatus Geothermarchaeota archaeon]HIQ13252.1 hypothetical protein [Thermoprotei archaeon]
MSLNNIIEAIKSCRNVKFTSKLYLEVLNRLAYKYNSELLDHHLIKVDKVAIGHKKFLRIKGARTVFKTNTINTAFNIRNLLHASGYKNSKVKVRDGHYIVIAEAPDNIILSSYIIERLKVEDEKSIKLIISFLNDMFLRNLKRIKMLLKNTKF